MVIRAYKSITGAVVGKTPGLNATDSKAEQKKAIDALPANETPSLLESVKLYAQSLNIFRAFQK